MAPQWTEARWTSHTHRRFANLKEPEMPLRENAPKLPPEQYERNFADIAPRRTRGQGVVEAARCLYCFDAPCTLAWPTRIEVPGFLKKRLSCNLRGSARAIVV